MLAWMSHHLLRCPQPGAAGSEAERGSVTRSTEETVGWTTFGCGARRFGVRGQAKRDPALAHSAWGSGPPKRRRRCALPAHSKGPACRLSSGLLCMFACKLGLGSPETCFAWRAAAAHRASLRKTCAN